MPCTPGYPLFPHGSCPEGVHFLLDEPQPKRRQGASLTRVGKGEEALGGRRRLPSQDTLRLSGKVIGRGWTSLARAAIDGELPLAWYVIPKECPGGSWARPEGKTGPTTTTSFLGCCLGAEMDGG